MLLLLVAVVVAVVVAVLLEATLVALELKVREELEPEPTAARAWLGVTAGEELRLGGDN